MKFIKFIIILTILFSINNIANASRISDSYDGNIFPIYAGNGSIVPPQTNLKESQKNNRISLLFFYLDDSSDSKSLAPLISGLDLIWRNKIDIIALTTDELQGKSFQDPQEEGYYWNGFIPQTVVIDNKGEIKFDKNGEIDIDQINNIIAEILEIDIDNSSFTLETFNEYNSIISKKQDTGNSK